MSPTAASAYHKPAIDGAQIDRYRLHPQREFVDFRSEAIKSGGKPQVYSQPRIGVRQIGRVPIATMLPADLLTLNTVYNIYFTKSTDYSLQLVLALLLSKVGQFYWLARFFDQKKTFPKVKKPDLLSLPLPTISADQRNRLSSMAERMLSLNAALSSEPLPHRREQLQREIDATDRQIDRLVYDLYGLTADDVALVEAATAKGA